MKIKKSFAFYHTLKGAVCLGLLDVQDANSTLKCGVFAKHFGIIISTIIILIFLLTSVSAESICEYASSASATSQNSQGSLAQYATGSPNAPNGGECNLWSGYGYSWSPSSWSIKSTLTLNYNTPVQASDLRIIGDYDMCWNKIWLKNSKTGAQLKIFEGIDNSCVLTKSLDGNFLADSVILETCGWSWSSTDAVQLCGTTTQDNPAPEPLPESDIEICKWKNCKKGAVSVSVDDGLTSCMQKLESNGFRGTYFLSGTDTYSQTLWNTFRSAYAKGNELAAHTRTHWCIELPESQFISEVENNVRDIVRNTGITRSKIITFGYPCGFSTERMQGILRTNTNWKFLSSRGYNYNQLEDSTPENFFDLKSFNSKGYPGGNLEPDNYLNIVNEAEEQEKWANLIFHVECNDDGVIDSLPSRNIWTDTIGNVVKYIKLRDNAEILNLVKTSNEIRFTIKTPTEFKQSQYNQDLTLKIIVPSTQINFVTINSLPVQYSSQIIGDETIIILNVKFPIDDLVRIRFN